MQTFSREASRAFFDANIAQFGRARLDKGSRAQNRDLTPVVIVGIPRSGTTLSEQIVAAHPQAFGAGEPTALGQAWLALGGGHGVEAVARIPALGQPALDEAAASYLAELHALAPEATRVVDKMPGNFNYLGLAALMLPGGGSSIARASARHRAVDLHLPLLRLPSICERSCRSRLVHRPA
jgi:hypothetical protein